MDAPDITPIKIDDTDFLVATTIERCPKTMMIRELTKTPWRRRRALRKIAVR